MLQIKNLTLTHKKDLREILSDFSCVFNNGDKAVIIGEEGNGKSTLLKWLYDPSLVEEYCEAEGERLISGEVLGYLAQELSDQQETYNETLEKWNEFSTYIDGNAVCARYNGVITGVELEAGDKISTGTSLVTLYDMDEVTMTVTVDEDDMTDISLGSAANIALTVYPEDTFTAKVTAIGDATSDSNGNITYDVTVTLEGDVSGLFQGMTGDVTFVTEQTEEVLYVSHRAIITEDDKTYVKVKTADGSIVKKEITTGLSDDSNVEISGDIAEGDIVLIESSITK